MKTAKLLKDNLNGFTGHAALYELSEPIVGYDNKKHKFVICSTAYAMLSGIETYIFPANKKGKITNWGELDGSMRGVDSHREVLKEAGFELI